MEEDVILQGIAFLVSQQQQDGSFLSYSTPGPNDFTNAKVFHTIFPTALILHCLNGFAETGKTEQILKKASTFLLSQKSPVWSFNYWARDSKEAKDMPYPDDLDDTFCALSSLYEYKPELFDGAMIAKIVQILRNTEAKPGGPYRTWIVGENAADVWKDVDVAVNSNVAYFLTLQDVQLPKLRSFLESEIASGNLTSKYYPTPYPVIYFLSRFYKGKQAKTLRDMLLSKRQGGFWENPLYTALEALTVHKNAMLFLKEFKPS